MRAGFAVADREMAGATTRRCRYFGPGVIVLLCALGSNSASGAAPGEVDFSRDVLPILSDNCFLCHGPDVGSRKGGLRLDVQEGALRGKDPVIVPGKSDESEVIARVLSHDADEIMPPAKSHRRLSAKQTEVLCRWIDQGAKWGKPWAFEARRNVAPPTPSRGGTDIRNPIDAFVEKRLETEGFQAAPAAGQETLIRRLTLDLTGLPPTPADVDTFLADRSPGAYEALVDRLLGSPLYGEKMVWDWLDAARYADSNGYQGDQERTMWPWRDWAIRAINTNMPFDEFTVLQIAGDLLPGATNEQKLATGFCRNHMINGEGGRIAEENRVDYVMDMSETTGTVWLGMTFNCCRCHDHKYDPLSQRDYYRMFAFFNQTPVTGGGGNPQTAPVIELPTREQAETIATLREKARAAVGDVDRLERVLFPRPAKAPASESPKASVLRAEIVALLKVAPGQRTKVQIDELAKLWESAEPGYSHLLIQQREAIAARAAYAPSIPRVMVMEDMAKPRETFVLARGSYEKPAEKVDANVPASLPPLPSEAPRNRLGLARWLVAPENPLTARVIVNRVWQQFFGMGLVKTSEDFGVQGEPPSHPELLDWLANEFIRSGWDMKSLHRLILTSAAYRRSSRVTPQLTERDPHNRLLARGPRFRLPAWMIRDQALAASGLLVTTIGGAPVKPYQPAGVWEEATFGNKKYAQDHGEALYRRSLYTFWRRIVGPTEFFDVAPRQTCVVKSQRTNSPLHALTTLNDVTYVECARVLAERALETPGLSPEERVAIAFRRVLARNPTADERQVLTAGVARARAEFAADPEAAKKLLSVGESKRNEAIDAIDHAAYTALCSSILNLDEALSKE